MRFSPTSMALAALVTGPLIWLVATVYHVPRSDSCTNGEDCMPLASALGNAGLVIAGLGFVAILFLIAAPSHRRR